MLSKGVEQYSVCLESLAWSLEGWWLSYCQGRAVTHLPLLLRGDVVAGVLSSSKLSDLGWIRVFGSRRSKVNSKRSPLSFSCHHVGLELDGNQV